MDFYEDKGIIIKENRIAKEIYSRKNYARNDMIKKVIKKILGDDLVQPNLNYGFNFQPH